MSLNIISTQNTSASLENSIEQIQDNFRHLSVLWDGVHSVASSGSWTRSAWSSLQNGLKNQLVNLIGSVDISRYLVWPQFVYYIANGNQFESLVPFEVHSTAGVKNLVGSGGASDHCWVIYLDSDKKLQKMICNPFLVNGIGLSGNTLKWTYDGQDTGIFVSGPPSVSKTYSTHLYIARCVSEYSGGEVSGIPTGIENQEQLELSARGDHIPSVNSRSYGSRQVELIGITDTDISGVESGSPVLVLDYAQSSKNASNIWVSTLKKSGNTLYAYCGESNMISAHHTTNGLQELVSKSNSQSPVCFLSFDKNKKLKIYSDDNNNLIIDLVQSTLNIEYPVIITRNRDQYNMNMIDTSEPLLGVNEAVTAQRGVVLRGTDNGSAWGRCVQPINESESVLTLKSISTLRNTSVTGRDWVLSYAKRNSGEWLDGYYPVVTDEYPQVINSTQYINTTGEYSSSIPCKALMCNGIAARQAQRKQVQQKTNLVSAESLASDTTTSPTEYNTFQFDWRCLFKDIHMNADSSIGYGSIFSVFKPSIDASTTEEISIPTGKYYYSRYGDDLFRDVSGNAGKHAILLSSKQARENYARVCKDYNKIFIIYIGGDTLV